MAKYHINKAGEPGVCNAAYKCPFGSAEEHHDSPEAARDAYEKEMTAELVPEGASKKPLTRDDVDRIVSEARDRGEQPNLRGANLANADLEDALLYGADLREANLRGANLADADLVGAYLDRADLSGAAVYRADLRLADLRETNLNRADLSGADLLRAKLSDADLRETRLDRANLSDADLSGANLRGANLREANLSGADLSGADLEGTGLRTYVVADLREAKR